MARFTGVGEGEAEQLAPGTPYVVMESKPYLTYTLFQSVVKGGRKGLVLSRHPPAKLGEMGLTARIERAYWLCRTPGEGRIDATGIGDILRVVTEFTAGEARTAVLLDGFEYLMVNNGFDAVLRLIQRVNEVVMERGSVLLMPVNPHALSKQELAILCREMFVLESPLTYGLDVCEVDQRVQ